MNNSHKDVLEKTYGRESSLFRLNLGYLNLSSLPENIRALKNLTDLYLCDNKFKDIPEQLFCLKKLEYLDVSFNEITSFPIELTNLENLEYLELQGNQITTIPREIKNLKNLKHLNLQGNPITDPPIEIANRGIDAIINYFNSIDDENTITLNEAKLLLVGQGGVGKTALMHRLIYDNVDSHLVTTEGVDINKWEFSDSEENVFSLNLWDFGGQEIYHATHQFFLTKRSIYLFIWEARRDDDLLSFDYWLNVVKLLSNNSPVLIVLNKEDERIKSIDEPSLIKRFPNIKGFHKISALKNTGIESLKKSIFNIVGTLDHIGVLLPKSWVEIRTTLEKQEKDFVMFEEYVEICSKYKLTDLKARYLSDYFHDLGVFLHFKENSILKEIVFLKPEWATNAVYKLVDTKQIQENLGKFTYGDLDTYWSNYPKEKYKYLIELMIKFELCFKLNDSDYYIIPELLRVDEPSFDWAFEKNMRFEICYDFMPAGILTRFIARNHDLVKDEIYWKNGVVIKRGNTEALIRSDILCRKIQIFITGTNKVGILDIIRREFDSIHRTLNNPPLKEKIPCLCSNCEDSTDPYFFDFQILNTFLEKDKPTINCMKSAEDVDIQVLLGSIKRKSDPNIPATFNNIFIMNIDRSIINEIKVFDSSANENLLIEILDRINALDADLKEALKEDVLIACNSNAEIQESKSQRIKDFLIKQGISLANNLTASALFELLKYSLQ